MQNANLCGLACFFNGSLETDTVLTQGNSNVEGELGYSHLISQVLNLSSSPALHLE